MLGGGATEADGALTLTEGIVPGSLVQALAPALPSGEGFEIEVLVSLPTEEPGAYGGVLFGWSDNGTFGYAALHPPEIWLGSFTDGVADDVVDLYDDGLYNNGYGPLRLRIRAEPEEGRVRVWLDGVLVLDGDELPVGGRLGLFAKDSPAVFDDLVIRRP